MKKFKLPKAKGTFIPGILCSLCGLIDSMTNRFIVDSQNEYKSSFTEKVISRWVAFSADSIRYLEDSTLEKYVNGCMLAEKYGKLNMINSYNKDSVEEKRRIREISRISDEITAICAEMERCCDDTRNSMKKTASKYQKLLVAYFAGFRKKKQYSFQRRIFITDEVDVNNELKDFYNKSELLKNSV